MAYSEKVVDHYENPRNVGAFDKGDESVGTGMVGAPACGDVMKLHLWLWLGHCLVFAGDRMGQGQDTGPGASPQKQRNR